MLHTLIPILCSLFFFIEICKKKEKEKDEKLIKINIQQFMNQILFLRAGIFLCNYMIRRLELILSFIPMSSNNSFTLYLFSYH